MRNLGWLLRLATLNLLRNGRRNLITGIALTSSFAGILLFTGYVVWVEKYLRANTVFINQTGHLLIARENGYHKQLARPAEALLKIDEQTKIRAILSQTPGVLAVGEGLQSLIVAVKGCQNRGVLAIGRDPAIDAMNLERNDVKRWSHELLHPELVPALSQFKVRAPSEAAVFPSPPMDRFLRGQKATGGEGCDPGRPQDLQLLARAKQGGVNAMDAESLGVQSTGLAILDEHAIYMPTSDLKRLLDTDSVGYYSVYLRSLLDLPAAWHFLHKSLARSGLKVEVLPFFDEEVGLYYIGSMAFLGAIAAFFVLLVSAVVALTLFSLFSMAITERSMEVGLLLALGFPAKSVTSLFEWEAILLTLLSLTAGLIAALGLSEIIIAKNIRFSPPGIAGDTRFTIAWEPWVMIATALMFVLATFIAVRLVTRFKLGRSVVSLLQDSATL